jgi:ABC-type polysaccharide/polyol phosphate transport system ATPase subunit
VNLSSVSEVKAVSADESAKLAVMVQDVSLTYRTTFERRPTLKSALVRLGRGERAVTEVQAVQNVTFDVPHGNAVGIIGANGAGKSTLLRMIAGILPPSSGRIEVHGRVSTLLSLGVGFNQQLSGRENVVLGGLAAGMSKAEVADKYEEIADFAELGEFIDMPLRTYSSGMFQRLAFSVAVHMDPDLLIVDEALSAGDAQFKQKAAAKMHELVTSAHTMFLVSHALGTVKDLCNDAIWMHKGRLMMRGEPGEVIDEYSRFLKVGEDAYSMEDF